MHLYTNPMLDQPQLYPIEPAHTSVYRRFCSICTYTTKNLYTLLSSVCLCKKTNKKKQTMCSIYNLYIPTHMTLLCTAYKRYSFKNLYQPFTFMNNTHITPNTYAHFCILYILLHIYTIIPHFYILCISIQIIS